MSSDSEHSEPVGRRTQTTKKEARREALERLKSSKTASGRARPSFLGADDDDADAGELPNLFDGLAAVNAAAARMKKRPAEDRDRVDRAPPARDALLGNAFDDLFDLDGATGAAGEDLSGAAEPEIDIEGGAKKRRVVAKMDEARLTGEMGFPKLQRELKKVKIKGRGHELADLRRVLTLYQLWTHEMFPRTNLRDTLATVEKLCHKRSVQRALKQYRDVEKNGASTSAAAEEDDLFGDLASSAAPFGVGAGGGAAAAATTSSSAAATKGKGKEPAQPDAGEDDWFADEEEILAELEREASASGPAKKAPEQKKRMVFEEDDAFAAEEEAILAELEREAAAGSSVTAKKPEPPKERRSMVFEEDEDMFAAEEEILAELEREAGGSSVTRPAQSTAAAAQPKKVIVDEDEDMYGEEEDLLAEMEREAAAGKAGGTSASGDGVEAKKAEEKKQEGVEKALERREPELDEDAEAEAALREAEELLGF
ncbi:hypothetical protein JCM10213_007808 [Rhodosporidiobolus nylandii]